MMKPIFVEYGKHFINLCLVESVEVIHPPSDTGGEIRVVMIRGSSFMLTGSQTIDFMRAVGEHIHQPLL